MSEMAPEVTICADDGETEAANLPMSDRKQDSWFYPKLTGDLGRDRNARTLQIAYCLGAFAIVSVLVVNLLAPTQKETPLLMAGAAGLLIAATMNRAGKWEWAARIGVLSALLTAILLVAGARDGFRSHAMLMFPGLLFIAVMLLDRTYYLLTAAIVLLAVAGLGVAEIYGLVGQIPPVRTPTSYAAILSVDLHLLAIAIIGCLIVRDTERNVVDLDANVQRLSAANGELERAYDARRQRETIYRAVWESLDYGMWMCAPDGRNIYNSESLLKLVGKTQKEMADYGWADFVHPEDRVKTLAAWEKCVRSQQRWEMEYRVFGADGEWHTTLSRGVPVHDEQGVVTCWAGMNLDLDALRLAQQSLRRSEAQAHARAEELQAVMDAAPAAILLAHDTEARRITGNRRAYELLRQIPGDNLSKAAPEQELVNNRRVLVDGVEVPADELPFHRVAHSGQPLRNYQLQYLFEDGSAIDLLGNAHPLLDADGRPRGAVAVLIDVTETKRAADALRQNEARLREAAHVARLGYMSWDAQSDMTTWSEEMYRILGWDRNQQPPRMSERYRIYTPESWTRLERAIQRALSEGESYELDVDVVRPDGTIRYAHVRGAPERNAQGRVVRLYGTLQDVTEQKLAEKQLRRTQWAESFRLLSRGIAHDFNNLLGAVLAETEIALTDAPAGVPAQEALRRIQGLAERASEIVRELLIYSGHEQPAIVPINLPAVVRDMLELLRGVIPKGILLRTESGASLPPVMADAGQLRQVILNLVINAGEAIKEETGAVDLAMTRVSFSEGELASVPGGDYVRLEISDTGCGMTEETRSRIFEPFFSTKGEGRGLGLASVHAIVQANGGFIDVVSTPGRGSRFTVLFPSAAAVPETTERAPVRDSVSAALRTITVLVVEDEEALRLATSKILSKRGFSVLQAGDGNAALERLQSAETIDLILLDVSLPGATSREVLRRAEMEHPSAKVILTTAYSRDMVIDTFEGSRISGFLRKPYRLADLVQLLEELSPAQSAGA
jgi:PAS domain S-box-containing protein